MMPIPALRPRRRPFAAVVLAVVALMGCGEQAGSDDVPDGDHRLIEGHGPGGAIPLVDGSPVTLSIEGDDWGGTAACNTYGGTVDVDGDRLRVREVFRTEMGCLDERVMASERRYLDAFVLVERYALDGDRLVLHGPDTELVFERSGPDSEAAPGPTSVISSMHPSGRLPGLMRRGRSP